MSKNGLLEKSAGCICVLSLLFLAAGCSNNYTPPPAPAVTIAPNPVAFPATTQGASSTPISVTVTNSGTGTLNIASITSGGANPGDFSSTNTCNSALTASANCSISVTFKPTVPGQRSETITLTDNASGSPQVIQVNGAANAIAITLTPPASAIGVSQSLQFTAAGDPNGVNFSVIGAPFLGAPGTIASPGTIDATGNYSGPGAGPSFYATVTATSKTDPTKSASATVNVVAPGLFANTNNVQVAQYAVTPPSPASVSVQFGLTAAYGFNTWTQPNPSLGSPVSLYVAGMTQSTPYHMRGLIQFADGTSFTDSDFTFTTGALQANSMPNLTVTTTQGITPQPGVELLDLIALGTQTGLYPLVVTDLVGNVIWTYNPVLPAGIIPGPIKMLPNGHFLINFNGGAPDGINSFMQEVDLAGNLIWQMTAAQLNTALAAATCAECDVTVIGTHHDFAVLPNGHLIVIAATQQVVAGVTVTGDIIIDLGDMENVGGNNPNHTLQPVWAWNEFNHLDINRQPYSYPDWTHTNAVIYSASDGNLIISIRHQNWLVKIPYRNGAGSGNPIWRLGYQGDFTLLNADGSTDTNPFDWFYAQHGPNFTTTNTSGQFSLILFDNGDDRGVSVVAGGTCGVAGQPACYSTVPLLNLDETALTATQAFHPTTPDYSFFGGSADALKNGNVEYTECADGSIAGNNAAIFEVTQTSPSQTVWEMLVTGQYAYRGLRIGSLYPGVQW